MMAIKPAAYDELRAWLQWAQDRILPLPPSMSPEVYPVAALDALALRSKAQARQGLEMAINDLVEMTADWDSAKVAVADNELAAAGLSSLSAIRLRFSKKLKRIVRRGRVANEDEYYTVRNAVDSAATEDERVQLWRLLAEFEATQPLTRIPEPTTP